MQPMRKTLNANRRDIQAKYAKIAGKLRDSASAKDSDSQTSEKTESVEKIEEHTEKQTD